MTEISYIIKAIDYSEEKYVAASGKLIDERWAAAYFNSEEEAANFIEQNLPSDKYEIIKQYYKC